MKLMLTILLLTITFEVFAPTDKTIILAEGERLAPYESIWRAVCLVESSGNRLAHNIKEDAVGIAQIRPIRIKDFNRRTGKHYKHSEMYDTTKAKEVFLYYFNIYDIDKSIRKWNGSGVKSYEYLAKVKKLIKQ